MEKIIFLTPFFSSRPWHGNKLSHIYSCPSDTGEAWIVSGIKDKASIVIEEGLTLDKYFDLHKGDLFGMPNAKEFPLLLKIIDASSDLSIQVHPDNEYARIRHNGNGKFESWYFLPGNTAKEVVVGTTCKNKEEMENAIKENRVEKVIKKSPLKEGDYMNIVPGTVHALKGGSLVLETQQPSDITYRLYDYNRKPLRELHIEDSLNVIDYNLNPVIRDFSKDSYDENKYFTFDKFEVKNEVVKSAKKFNIFYIIEGKGTINGNEVNKYQSGIVFTFKNEMVFKGKMILALINAKG
jgi:mannose-6-phosphate isomerase